MYRYQYGRVFVVHCHTRKAISLLIKILHAWHTTTVARNRRHPHVVAAASHANTQQTHFAYKHTEYDGKRNNCVRPSIKLFYPVVVVVVVLVASLSSCGLSWLGCGDDDDDGAGGDVEG